MLIRLRSVPNKRAARSDRDINKPLSCGRMVEVRVILDAERDANGPPPRVETSLTTCCAHKTTLSCAKGRSYRTCVDDRTRGTRNLQLFSFQLRRSNDSRLAENFDSEAIVVREKKILSKF